MKQRLILLILSIFLSTAAFGNFLQAEKQKYHAKGVAVVIIDSVSSSAYMIHEESSEKGSAQKLTRDYLFEPGNAMMPISFALLLDKNSKWSNTKMIDCRNIDMTKEDCKENYAKDAIVYSSSRIMDMVTAHLKADDLHNGLHTFGFTHVPSLEKLKQNIYKTLCARGYGIQTNLLELTMAYRIFSFPGDFIKKETAKEMRKLLIEAVKKGTGKNAQIKGMLIGGKTGTALMINKKTKRYYNQYNAVFIGFANGKGHKYTIGVLVINPKVGKLASKTAVNVFKDVVKSLLNDPFELGKQEYKKGNIKKAIKLINKACNSGNSLACYNLALLYESGQNVKPDLSKAKKYYKKSCENGFELACRIYKNVY